MKKKTVQPAVGIPTDFISQSTVNRVNFLLLSYKPRVVILICFLAGLAPLPIIKPFYFSCIWLLMDRTKARKSINVLVVVLAIITIYLSFCCLFVHHTHFALSSSHLPGHLDVELKVAYSCLTHF